MPHGAIAPQQRAVAAWLIACCALVFAMVVVGGITCLTRWGLSIVEWQPTVGTLLLVVPVPLAAAHQAGALPVFTAASCLTHALCGTRSARAEG